MPPVLYWAEELAVGRMTGSGYGRRMEPLPETFEALEQLGGRDEENLLGALLKRTAAARWLVPDLVGVSVTALEDGLVFTMVASDAEVAVLDAVQYALGGPCAEVPGTDKVVEHDPRDPDDEQRWQAFARATAAKAIAATLTLPILVGGMPRGSVNLYAASSGAFTGLHEELAAIFDAWAPGAVTNADLSFRTRRSAEQAPARLEARSRVETAVGMLAAPTTSTPQPRAVCWPMPPHRAGVSVEQLASTMVDAFGC